MTHPIQITDEYGRFPNHAYDREPEPASVVLTQGEFGTAWQRHFNDGLWHSRGRPPRTWDSLIRCRNVVLVYDAPVREPAEGRV